MLASIAEQGLKLWENELQQAAQSLRMPQTPLQTVVRVSPLSTGSFHTALSLSDSFQVLETRNPPENGFSQPNALQKAHLKTPQRIFHIPSPTHSLGHYVSNSLDSSLIIMSTQFTLTIMPTHSASTLALPTTSHQGILPLVVSASPLS